MQERHEIAAIAGAPAGVTAALRAHELGASVALVEQFGQRLRDEAGTG